MTVYVLSRIDYHDRSEVVGVFSSPEAAQRTAEASEADRRFEWEWVDGTLVAPATPFGGPIYGYSVERFEVSP